MIDALSKTARPPRLAALPLVAAVVAAGLLLGAAACAAGGGRAEAETAPSSPAPSPVGPTAPAAGGSGDGVAASRDSAMSVLEFPPPPGLDQQGLPAIVERLRDQPAKPYAEVAAALSPPGWLPPADAEPAATPEPTLEAQRAYAVGRLAMRSGARFEARRRLEKAARLAPENPAVRRALGELFAASGDLERAAAHLRSAVRLDPNDTGSLLLLAKAAMRREDWPAAAALFEAARHRLDRDPRRDTAVGPVAGFHLAAALQRMGHPLAAAERLEAFLAESQSVPHVSSASRELAVLDRREALHRQTLGDLYLQLDRAGDARAAYRRAAEMTPVDPDLASRLIYTALLTGDAAAAREAALGLFGDRRSRSAAVALLGYLAEHGGDAKPLLAAVHEAYAESDRDPATALALAELMPRDRAIGLLQQHVEARPDDAMVLLRLLRLTAGDEPTPRTAAEAARALAPLLASHPERSPGWIDLLNRVVGDPELLASGLAAEEDATGDTAARPSADVSLGDAGLEAIYGVALAQLGRVGAAEAVLQRAFEAMPGLTAARIALARLAAASGDLDRAEALLAVIDADARPEAIAAKVRVLMRRDKPAEALALLESSLADRSTPGLVLLQARLLIAQGEVDAAEQALLDALASNPKHEPIYAMLFELYDADNPPDDSMASYQRLLRRVQRELPESRIARLKLGELFVVGGQLARAEQQLLPLVREDPADTAAVELLIEAYQKGDRPDAGVRLLEAALEARPGDPELLQLARGYFDEIGRDDRAAELGVRLLERQPAGPQRDRALAMLLIEAGRLDEARPIVERLMQEHGNEADSLRVAIRFYRAADEADRAEAATEKLLTMQPAGPQRDQALAFFYLRSERPAEAAPLLEKLFEREDPQRPELIASLLWQTYWQLGQPDRALAAIERAIERLPGHAADMHYQASVLHGRTGEMDRAEAALRKALDADPDHAPAANALAYQWALQNRNLDRALELVQVAVRGDRQSSAYLDTMGWVYYKLGRFDLAVEWLERARQADDGEYPIIVDHLGDALYRLGERRRAQRAWAQALQLLEGKDWGTEDPELDGLKARLEAKLEALEAGRDPATAIVPANEAA